MEGWWGGRGIPWRGRCWTQQKMRTPKWRFHTTNIWRRRKRGCHFCGMAPHVYYFETCKNLRSWANLLCRWSLPHFSGSYSYCCTYTQVGYIINEISHKKGATFNKIFWLLMGLYYIWLYSFRNLKAEDIIVRCGDFNTEVITEALEFQERDIKHV